MKSKPSTLTSDPTNTINSPLQPANQAKRRPTRRQARTTKTELDDIMPVSTKSPRPNYHPTAKTNLIVKTKQEHPDLTTREIAKIANCDHSNVVRTLQRYGIDNAAVEDFKTHRADVFAGLQERILRALTDDAIKRTPAIQLITAAGILFDKERLERNQSTGNHTVIIGALQDLQKLRSQSDD